MWHGIAVGWAKRSVPTTTIQPLWTDYRRFFMKGGIYFFTVVTHNRQYLLCNERALNRLKAAFRSAISKHPFKIKGLVILPDHLHCVWQLPENDDNFSMRWNVGRVIN